MLRVGETVATTAATFFHRYQAAKGCAQPASDSLLAACLFLATKVEEESRRSRDVLNTMHMVRHGELLRGAKQYWALKEQLVQQEQLLLRYLAFDTAVEQPQPLALHYLLLLRAPRGLTEASIAVLNDAVATSAECAALVPRLLATAAIAVAAELLQVRLRERWWAAFDVHEAELAGACHAILAAYERHGQRSLEEACAAKAADLESNPLLRTLAAASEAGGSAAARDIGSVSDVGGGSCNNGGTQLPSAAVAGACNDPGAR